jgi:predicted aminopeptidase
VIFVMNLILATTGNTIQDIVPKFGTDPHKARKSIVIPKLPALQKLPGPLTRWATVLLTLTAIILTLLHLPGCAGPSYYTQAISGHLALMGDREDIRVILDRAGTDPELQRELELALEIRAFATEQLGLPDNDSYTEFVRTGRQAVSWNVVAAPEFSIQARQWCFVVSGCVPYRGYFDQEKAAEFAQKMRDKSYDVTVSPAIAYSTLGWFDDPLLDTMLQYSDEQLAAFIFHELAHQQLYVKSDTVFNETYAGFVEEVAVRQWLQATGRHELLPHWQSMEKASTQFNELLMKTRARLAEEYNSGRSEAAMRVNKKMIFSDMKSEYQVMVNEQWNGRNYFKSWFSSELNNARLALINSYHGGVCAFTKLYESAGRDILQFQQLAAEKAAMGKEQRAAWLSQPCTVIASGRDL